MCYYTLLNLYYLIFSVPFRPLLRIWPVANFLAILVLAFRTKAFWNIEPDSLPIYFFSNCNSARLSINAIFHLPGNLCMNFSKISSNMSSSKFCFWTTPTFWKEIFAISIVFRLRTVAGSHFRYIILSMSVFLVFHFSFKVKKNNLFFEFFHKTSLSKCSFDLICAYLCRKLNMKKSLESLINHLGCIANDLPLR